MGKYRVLVSCDLGNSALERFAQESDFEVVVRDIKDEEALAAAIPGFHALIVRSNVKVTKGVLVAGKTLLVVGRAGMGTDNIDMAAATRLGVAVVNAPGGNSVTTGEHALALLLSLARNIPRADRSMREGLWEKKKFIGHELTGKTLGVVGAGRVGGVVAARARGLFMRVVAFDPYLTAERAVELGVEKVGFDELLAESDFITLHTPLTPETKHPLNRTSLEKCKRGVLLVNCARGPIIDEDALYEAIKSGRVGGAALDVFPVEPPSPHPLYSLEEVVITPHLGASTVEAQESVALETAQNLVAYLKRGVAATLQNAPKATAEALGVLAPYLSLASRLGLFLAQAVDGPVERVAVTCYGEAAGREPEIMAAAAVRGLLKRRMSERLNLVNALSVAAEVGISVSWGASTEVSDFVNMIEITLSGPWGARRAEGALFGKREPRLVRLDGFRLDAKPDGSMILIFNKDVPGVIGAVGDKLGELKVNISGFYNGREKTGEGAIILVNIDGHAADSTISALAALPNVQSARRIVVEE